MRSINISTTLSSIIASLMKKISLREALMKQLEEVMIDIK